MSADDDIDYDWLDELAREDASRRSTPEAVPTGEMPRLGHEVPMYCTRGMTRDEWVRRRRGYVGASQVASVLGWSPYESPLTEWEVITGRRTKFASDAMHMGTALETLIASHCASVTGRTVDPWPFVLRHPEVPHMTCNLDRITGRRVLELKYSGARYAPHWREFRKHGDPERMRGTSIYGHWLQVQSQLEITGLEEGELFAVVGEEAALKLVMNACLGTQLTVSPDHVFSFFVRRDREVGAWIADQVARFAYWHIERDEAPPATKPIDLAAVRRLLAPEAAGEPEKRDDLAELVGVVARHGALAERHKDEAATAKARLVQALGRYGSFEIAGRVLTHRKDKNGRASLRGIGAEE